MPIIRHNRQTRLNEQPVPFYILQYTCIAKEATGPRHLTDSLK